MLENTSIREGVTNRGGISPITLKLTIYKRWTYRLSRIIRITFPLTIYSSPPFKFNPLRRCSVLTQNMTKERLHYFCILFYFPEFFFKLWLLQFWKTWLSEVEFSNLVNFKILKQSFEFFFQRRKLSKFKKIGKNNLNRYEQRRPVGFENQLPKGMRWSSVPLTC